MYKRFQVLDLFFGKDALKDVEEWIDIKINLPDSPNGIYKVRLTNQNEIIAYFCSDKCSGLKPPKMGYSFWWDKNTYEPVHNVTHWGKRNEK